MSAHSKSCKNLYCRNGSKNSCIFFCKTQLEKYPNTHETHMMRDNNKRHLDKERRRLEMKCEQLYVQDELSQIKIGELEFEILKLKRELANTGKGNDKSKKTPKKVFSCFVCEVDCNSQTQFFQHLKSVKHCTQPDCIKNKHISSTESTMFTFSGNSPLLDAASTTPGTVLKFMIDDDAASAIVDESLQKQEGKKIEQMLLKDK